MTELAPGDYEAVLNGIRIHYSIRGAGPALIAHSGGPGADARAWDDLARIDDFATVIILHPRGSGLSDESPDQAYRLADYAADLEALRLHLGLERPAVMGWSHGGMVAQQFAFTYPSSLSKLILLATSAYFGEFLEDIEAAVQAFRDQPWYEKSFTALKKEWDGEYETDEEMTALFAEMIRFYFKEFDARAQAYRDRTKHLLLRSKPLKVFNEQEAETLDLRPRLPEITVPTLVLAGRHDFITTAGMAEEMVRHLPNARLKIFENSGHFVLIEEPAEFHASIKAFLTGD